MRFTRRLAALGTVLCLATARSAQAQDPGLPPPTKHPATPAAGAGVPRTVTTGFDPAIDPPPFSNPGDFAEPGGECMGMSGVAIDNFIRRKAAEANGVPTPAAQPVAHSAHEADAVTQALVSREQSVIDQEGIGAHSPIHEVGVHDPKAIDAALERIARTGEPELMTISGREDGHATVLFGYKEGKLQVYDPNYPRETLEWPFDPVKGLGRHPKVKDDSFYGTLKTAGSTPFSDLAASKDLALLRSDPAALAKVDAKRFPTIAVSTTPGANGALVVSGTVSRGPKKTEEGEPTTPAARVWVLVNGKPITQAKLVKGAYKVTLPAGALGESPTVRVVAITGEREFAGFADATVAPREGISRALEGSTSSGH